jgi:hypothetical protein
MGIPTDGAFRLVTEGGLVENITSEQCTMAVLGRENEED